MRCQCHLDFIDSEAPSKDFIRQYSKNIHRCIQWDRVDILNQCNSLHAGHLEMKSEQVMKHISKHETTIWCDSKKSKNAEVSGLTSTSWDDEKLGIS